MAIKNTGVNDFERLKRLYIDSRTGLVPKLILLSGEEEYPLVSYIKQLRSIVSMPELNITEFRDPFSYESVRSSFDTLPIMNDFRLVLLNKTGYFKWNKDERFHSLFADIPEHIRLVVFETDLNKTSSNYKKLEKNAQKIVLEKANKEYLVKWSKSKLKEAIRAYGSDCSVEVSNDAVYRLADFGMERGMFAIKNAIDAFVAGHSQVSVAVVEDYFGSGQKHTVWALYDSMAGERFIPTLMSLLEDGEDEFELFGRIGSAIRGGLKFKRGAYEGTPYMTKIASGIAAVFDMEQLQQLVSELAKIDMEMKSTGASKRNLMMQIAMKIDALRRK